MDPERTPATLLRELAEEMRELSEAADSYGRARRKLAQSQVNYERAMTEQLIALQSEYRTAGERLPGEEMRKAICHDRIEDELRDFLLISEAEVEALDKFIRVKTAVVSALQSELSFLRTEYQIA
jgi:NTP pyrophosphatase (non-canonical NTP hydrolase)